MGRLLNKALLWKEWRQNRWLLAVLFLFVIFTPVIEAMLEWLQTVFGGMMGILEVDRQWLALFGFENAWSFEVAGAVKGLIVTESGRAVGFNPLDRKSTRLNSSHVKISYAVFCLKKKKKTN